MLIINLSKNKNNKVLHQYNVICILYLATTIIRKHIYLIFFRDERLHCVAEYEQFLIMYFPSNFSKIRKLYYIYIEFFTKIKITNSLSHTHFIGTSHNSKIALPSCAYRLFIYFTAPLPLSLKILIKSMCLHATILFLSLDLCNTCSRRTYI